MDRPLVSVCLPVYNGARFLRPAVQSVLDQTYPHFELLVFDDASSDGSWEILQEIQDPRVVLHRNAHNLGPEANWNQALFAARGRYVKLFHQDDLLAPECLERQVRALEEHPEAVLAFGKRRIITPDGRRLMTRGGPWPEGLVAPASVVRRCVLAGTNLIGEPSAVLFAREVACRTGTFDGRLPYVIDLDYWIRLLAQGPAYSLDAALTSFRLSPAQWSAAIGRHQVTQFLAFLSHLAAGPIPTPGPWALRWGRVRTRLNGRARVAVHALAVRGRSRQCRSGN